MTSKEIREKFFQFFREQDHTIIPSASLVPENDPSVLFTTAGMHPLIPYFMGEPHPQGKRLANSQKCIRTQDIDEVGDATHDTFFEMLGFWSLGDYFKREAIEWLFAFITGENGLNIPLEKLAVTVFAGDDDAPRDEEAAAIWKSLGIPEERIFYLGKEDNWWGPPGKTGPCGPDTEVFYDMGSGPIEEKDTPGTYDTRFYEICNNVFMQFEKHDDGSFTPLAQKNVDMGMGLERVAMALQEKDSIFETDLFAPAYEKVRELSLAWDEMAARIVCDHLRTAMFMIADGVRPSNLDQGYILRRLIRRAIRYSAQLEIPEEENLTKLVVEEFQKVYDGVYPELSEHRKTIFRELQKEEEKFERTLGNGLKHLKKEIEKLQRQVNTTGDELIAGGADSPQLPGSLVFDLYQTYGFPLELTVEEGKKLGFGVHEKEFHKKLEMHQETSRAGSTQRFAGGLGEDTPETRKLHTATHLLLAGLRKVLGEGVLQRGSNITPKRLRLDFSHPDKLTDEQKEEVEKFVNDAIAADLPVQRAEMTVDEAKEAGALGVFDDKYGDKVSVYTVKGFSKEICGGPHVEKTGELGSFRIKKQEASSAGVRRIKAIVE